MSISDKLEALADSIAGDCENALNWLPGDIGEDQILEREARDRIANELNAIMDEAPGGLYGHSIQDLSTLRGLADNVRDLEQRLDAFEALEHIAEAVARGNESPEALIAAVLEACK